MAEETQTLGKQLRNQATALGIEYMQAFDPQIMRFLPEVREMCAADKCRRFNKNWSCPPAIGSLEEWQSKAATFTQGLLLQSVARLEDPFDYETMQACEKELIRKVATLKRQNKERAADLLFFQVGACTLCPQCTYPDAPCRRPDEMSPSLEAVGIFVTQLCRDAGLSYYYGPNTIAFTAAVLYR